MLAVDSATGAMYIPPDAVSGALDLGSDSAWTTVSTESVAVALAQDEEVLSFIRRPSSYPNTGVIEGSW